MPQHKRTLKNARRIAKSALKKARDDSMSSIRRKKLEAAIEKIDVIQPSPVHKKPRTWVSPFFSVVGRVRFKKKLSPTEYTKVLKKMTYGPKKVGNRRIDVLPAPGSTMSEMRFYIFFWVVIPKSLHKSTPDDLFKYINREAPKVMGRLFQEHIPEYPIIASEFTAFDYVDGFPSYAFELPYLGARYVKRTIETIRRKGG